MTDIFCQEEKILHGWYFIEQFLPTVLVNLVVKYMSNVFKCFQCFFFRDEFDKYQRRELKVLTEYDRNVFAKTFLHCSSFEEKMKRCFLCNEVETYAIFISSTTTIWWNENCVCCFCYENIIVPVCFREHYCFQDRFYRFSAFSKSIYTENIFRRKFRRKFNPKQRQKYRALLKTL